MVEATVIMPLFILTVLSLILLMIHFYSCLSVQTDMHAALLDRKPGGTVIVKTVNESEDVSSRMGGIISKIMNKELKARCYLINEINMADIADIGEMTNGRNEKTQ